MLKNLLLIALVIIGIVVGLFLIMCLQIDIEYAKSLEKEERRKKLIKERVPIERRWCIGCKYGKPQPPVNIGGEKITFYQCYYKDQVDPKEEIDCEKFDPKFASWYGIDR